MVLGEQFRISLYQQEHLLLRCFSILRHHLARPLDAVLNDDVIIHDVSCSICEGAVGTLEPETSRELVVVLQP